MTGPHQRRPRTLRLLILCTAAAGALASIPAGLALADSSGIVTETISVSPPATTSITLSTNSVTLCSSTPLTFPNGSCVSPAVTITNGSTPANIDISGAAATPSDNGISWTLCDSASVDPTGIPGDPFCTGSSDTPGQDQYREQTINGSMHLGPELAPSADPQCDVAFGGATASCAATSNDSATEVIDMVGPSASSDTSQSFQSSVTWTAVAS